MLYLLISDLYVNVSCLFDIFSAISTDLLNETIFSIKKMINSLVQLNIKTRLLNPFTESWIIPKSYNYFLNHKNYL